MFSIIFLWLCIFVATAVYTLCKWKTCRNFYPYALFILQSILPNEVFLSTSAHRSGKKSECGLVIGSHHAPPPPPPPPPNIFTQLCGTIFCYGYIIYKYMYIYIYISANHIFHLPYPMGRMNTHKTATNHKCANYMPNSWGAARLKKTRKNIHKSEVHVTLELYGHFICLQVLCST